MAGSLPKISVALGTYPHTKAFKARQNFGTFEAEFADISPISRAFAPMVRELRFDISELALMTFLQAKAYGKALALLPLVVAARFQESALLCRADNAIRGPEDLAGKRIGVRAYSQTTGVWLRGIFSDEYGLAPDRMRWITFEGAHVAEYSDPPFVERAPPGAELMKMLRAGEIDAAVVGNDVPDDPALRTVFRDPEAAAQRFWNRHSFVPVNHVLVARRSFADAEPGLVTDFVLTLHEAISGAEGKGGGKPLPFGRAALQPAIDVAVRHLAEQSLIPRTLSASEVWDGVPPSLLSASPGT